jgi:glycosyltransferase involved in cell wall biosynthesis
MNTRDKTVFIAPIVSVVLPLYNCPAYIGRSVQSILDQTFEDFELIIIDDGSTDNTPEIAKTFSDSRIRFFQQKNQGLASTLNRGIELARGKYIARHDQDDIALPERFAKQVNYLEAHPACGMVGTWADIYLEEEKTERAHRHPSDNTTLQYELLLNNPFVHSSMMLRKSILEQIGGYSTDRERQPPEDYELCSRIARQSEIANIPEILQIYREVPRSMSRNGVSPFLNHLVTIIAENIAWASGVSSSDPNPVNIAAIIHGAPHRIVGKPNFQLMRKTLQKAVARVSHNNVGMQRESEQRINQLQHAYQSANHISVGRKIYEFLRGIKKKISSRLKKQGK